MQKDENQSKEIARLLERTAARALKMQTDEVITAFDQVEETCLTLVSTKELVLEVKRRTAEWKFKLLCDQNVPFEIAERLHQDILGLGYSSLENEGGIELYFAQYCVRQNLSEFAGRILNQLCSKLDEALMTNDLEVFHHFREMAEQLLSKDKQ